MVEKINVEPALAFNMIRGRDKVQPIIGYKNLDLLARHKVEARGPALETIKQVFGSGLWQVAELDLQRNYSKMVSALKMVPKVN